MEIPMTGLAPLPPSARYGLPGCPECGPVELHPVFDGEMTNFYCPLCGTCWHVELGFVARVDPATCPGCQIRLICQERAARTALERSPS